MLEPGRYFLGATYPGDASFLANISPPSIFTITKAPIALSVQSNVGSAAAGQAVTLTANLDPRAAPYGQTPGGTVTFMSNGQPLGDPMYVSPAAVNIFPYVNGKAFITIGQAIMVTTSLPAGANSIVAVSSGDADYLPSTSPPSVVTIGSQNPRCAVTTFTASPNPISLYDTLGYSTITAQASCEFDIRVNGPGGQPPTTATNSYSNPVGHGSQMGCSSSCKFTATPPQPAHCRRSPFRAQLARCRASWRASERRRAQSLHPMEWG